MYSENGTTVSKNHPVGQMIEKLEAEGWFVKYNYWCCQSCGFAAASSDAPNQDKILFCHEQDVGDYQECPECSGSGEEDRVCDGCDGVGEIEEYDEEHDEEYFEECYECHGDGRIVETCYYCGGEGSDPNIVADPKYIEGCHWAFAEADELKTVIPLIESCGISVDWDGTQMKRPYLKWS